MAEVSRTVIENAEQQFLESLAQVALEPVNLEHFLSALEVWQQNLIDHLEHQRGCFSWREMADEHPIAQEMTALNKRIASFSEHWAKLWEQGQSAQDLAHYFDDKLMFLVYGKFNAGKSSFCNFVAERFLARGQEVSFFTVQEGAICPIEGPFKEGSTETTAEIQGVVLAGRMVLLDTPGLHSQTEENAALTRLFLESADGMLWLSSSTSPGQVQELETLAQELRRRKPLLPVITRSDFIEETVVNNQIVKRISNKTKDNRALQEEDLYARATEKLLALGVDPQVLVPAVSVSVYAAQSELAASAASAETDLILHEAGFFRLFTALEKLLPSMQRYKQRKPAEVLLHHLEEHVQEDVLGVHHSLEQLHAQIEEEKQSIHNTCDRMAQLLWQHSAAALPQLLDQQLQEQGSLQQLAAALGACFEHEQVRLGERLLSAYQPILSECVADVRAFKEGVSAFKRLSLENYEAVYKHLDEEVLRIAVALSKEVAARIDGFLTTVQERLAQVREFVHNSITELGQIRHQLVHYL